MEEIDLDGDVPIEQDYDFTHSIAQSLPSSVGHWLTNGNSRTRKLKFLLLLLAGVALVLVIFGVIVGVTLIVNLASSGSSSSSDEDVVWKSTFLPPWAQPKSYQIELSPNLQTFELAGSIRLVFKMLEDGHDFLILNSVDINVTTVTYETDSSISVDMIEYLEDLEMVVFHFSENLPANEDLEITIQYQGTIQEEMRGFYRSVYTDNNGQEHWLASTQFESIAARLAFPCFDEPDKKATFIITLKYKNTSGTLVCLSNMPTDSTSVEGGITTVTFQETPIMSTYLVAFLVGDFASVSGDYNGKPVKVWAPIGQEEQGLAALNVTVDALAYYEDFFDEPYTLPKLDLVAIPDFEAGAMENWGLITFRLTALLYNPAEDTAANLQRVATVVTHELAHQWTGDLVTMGWWGHLWLNEGFADFWETESVANILPEWNMRDQFLVEDQQRAFSVDALVSTHSIVQEDIRTGSDIQQMFDTITYSKGGSILRMMQDVLSPSVFEEGLQNYIAENKFSNTLTEDFLESMSATSGQPLTETFHEWLYNPGFPVITVSQSGKKITFQQERFYSAGDTDDLEESDNWWVHIRYITSDGEEHETAFQEEQTTESLSASVAYIKANVGQNGYYRVNYPADMWIKLKENIQTFSAADRAGLVNDVLVLARAGFVDTSTALEFTSFLREEVEYTVWISALSQLNYIGTMLSTELDYGLYELFMQDLLEAVVEYVGWDTLAQAGSVEPDHNKSLLRATVLNMAGLYELPSAVEQALAIWEAYRVNGTEIAPADRQAVYCTALHYGDASDYQFLFAHLLETDNAAEQNRVLYTLGCTREYYLLQATLDASLNSSIVRPQDQRTVIAGVSANPLGRDLAWNFVQSNFETFNTLGFSLGSLITIVTSSFNDEFHLREVEMFFEVQETQGASMAVEQAEETIQMNINWLETNGPDVRQWLRSRYL